MAVDLMSYRSNRIEEEMSIEEVASVGLKSMHHLVRLLSSPDQQQECRAATEATVGNFKKLISALDRTGHARFRRGPPSSSDLSLSSSNSSSSSQPNSNSNSNTITKQEPYPYPYPYPVSKSTPQPQVKVCQPVAVRAKHPVTLDFTNPKHNITNNNTKEMPSFSISSSANSSLMSSITGEGSVSNGKQFGSAMFGIVPTSNSSHPCSSSGKPPLSSSSSHHKKRCHDHHHHHHHHNDSSGDFSGMVSGSTSTATRCHCSSKRRKVRVKKSIRVPAVSSKVADIPSDEYSWRKYGQKPIKGSPYPRGYYKCSTVRGCPARKHVERATDDPSMLIVTYEGEHRHSPQPIIIDNLPTAVNNVTPTWLLSLQHHHQQSI